MSTIPPFALIFLGTVTGIASGILGIGGGLLMVPVLTLTHATVLQATATSLVGVFLSAISGSFRNWRANQLNLWEPLGLALGGIPTAQLGAWLGDRLPDSHLGIAFAVLLLVSMYLIGLRRQLQQPDSVQSPEIGSNRRSIALPLLGIGTIAGFLSGLFGVGGGVVMVPLQMVGLKTAIKPAVRNSLGAIAPISASALFRHADQGNVLWVSGLSLGLGCLLGAQIGTRLLHRLPSQLVTLLFRILLVSLAAYMLWEALNS